jgi:tetratricopeptide (TPR) repeat protein
MQPPLLRLPQAPAHLAGDVRAWQETVEILTYAPEKPDPNPMFLEKRVYQGSSGRVYPLPFTDRIATEPAPKHWQAIHIENEFLRLMILPEIGGRIHVGYDKTTGYDFFYRQNVIKPALVGLAGPWISGGVEFNWPQHHRPATFMPVETEIEQHQDGSITVWCGDHDPMLRMKGMHGVCLHPGRAVVQVKVRLFNRTQMTQTFLWWANVATRVHEKYQSFFPTDVRFVADHAKRAMTSFPLSNGLYYGVDYGERARSGVPAVEQPRCFVPDGAYPPNDLSWYANIPVPTSYMITGTADDFFGGYDHHAQAGVVHVADHHIAPGKKQWTWGNHEFGYAWDRSLTDHDGPYVELMAGVYTDNQPDFSFLAPWETKTFVQSWFPIHAIGVPQAANLDAALSLKSSKGSATVGVYVTRAFDEVVVVLRAASIEIARWTKQVDVAHPLLFSQTLLDGTDEDSLSVSVTHHGRLLIDYDRAAVLPAKTPSVAVEPLPPSEIPTSEELYLTGLHLQQYRHATRLPEAYWQEALRRDPMDSRVNNALGLLHLRRGEFAAAAEHFQAAIQRLTLLNPNPYDGEPYYNLGVTERYRKREKPAYDALYKATWNAAWRGPAYLALAEIDATRHQWEVALDHVNRSLIADADNLAALNLKVIVLQQLGCLGEAGDVHREIRALDPLDLMSRWRDGIEPANGQERLDLAFDFRRIGLNEEAAKVLRLAMSDDRAGSLPIEMFTLALIEQPAQIEETRTRANKAPLHHCLPSRLEEMSVLAETIAADSQSAPARYLLGNFLYDRRRHEEAIQQWEAEAVLDPSFPTVWRNLGIAAFNIRGDIAVARAAFDRALAADPNDGRILYERDQLWKRIGESPERRLQELQSYRHLISQRDDLSVELATLYNHVGRPEAALQLLLHRHFQPWEGGEGLVLAQYVRSCLLLGQAKLDAGDPVAALDHFRAALEPPQNLSEARHLLASQNDIYYWLGAAHEALGENKEAASWWHRATRQRGDFQQMSVRRISDMTYWTAMAHLRLGSSQLALFREILEYSIELERTEAKIDYFATSLPAMLLFEDDLQRRNRVQALFLRAQALSGMGNNDQAVASLMDLLRLDCNHAGATDLLRRCIAAKEMR